MGEARIEEKLLQPLARTGRGFYAFIAVLVIIIVWGLYAWYLQLTEGLAVTGLKDIGSGPPWGLYITNFVFFMGLALGGLVISAVIRIAGLRAYRPVARIAELLVPVSLAMSALSVLFDLGRPDRIINLFIYYPERVGQSPLAWDWTVIILYFALSTNYLFLTMRRDIALCAERFPRWRWIYQPLLIGYSPEEKEKTERLAWWMALLIPIPLILLSGGVLALLIGRPGWYGAFVGPYFVLASIASAIALVIFIAALLRRLFGWEEYIKPEVLKGLGNILATTIFVYLYFVFAEQITMQYPGPTPTPELSVSRSLLVGEFAPIFWTTVIVLFLTPSLAFLAQAVAKKFSLTLTALSALAILIGVWAKKFLFIVPPLTRALLPYPIGSYIPTWVEWSLVVGTFAVAALLYALFIKVLPVMEVVRD
jgi:molybdopterin-containing oxidoreductase family membrane subunit